MQFCMRDRNSVVSLPLRLLSLNHPSWHVEISCSMEYASSYQSLFCPSFDHAAWDGKKNIHLTIYRNRQVRWPGQHLSVVATHVPSSMCQWSDSSSKWGFSCSCLPWSAWDTSSEAMTQISCSTAVQLLTLSSVNSTYRERDMTACLFLWNHLASRV